MPSTKSLEILARQQPLTNEDWVNLIEIRRALLKPRLDSFTLPTLGKVKCLRREHWEEELGEYRKTSGDTRFSGKTQGIFFLQPYEAMERTVQGRSVGGIKKIWGLTRAGKWLIATVPYILIDGYKGRGLEIAEDIEIVEADVAAILSATKTPPREVWDALGKAIRSFAQHREKLYAEAQALVRMVEVDEILARFIPDLESETETSPPV